MRVVTRFGKIIVIEKIVIKEMQLEIGLIEEMRTT